MTTEAILFWLLAAMIGSASVGLVFSQNIVRCAIWLLGALVGIALLYFLLGAEFVGATQMIVYVGGTMVLVVFAVMLTAQQALVKLKPRPMELIGICMATLVIFLLIVQALPKSKMTVNPPSPTGAGIGSIGMALLGMDERRSFLFPFEIVSLHLLVALIGAAYLARAKRRPGTSEAKS